jgi:hypothetical protein|tara:strand:+ start:113 stop:436 length:324 start_codon:yes stop_codon:yes gene_type:complete
MAYASGKFAIALCDRCGFQYKLLDLKEEWNGLKTCSECFESKHPQLEPNHAPSDPQGLYKPRPNTDVELGEGFVVVTDNNFMNPANIGSNFEIAEMTASVGAVTITL